MKVKYMGTSDVKRVLKGHDFAGQLSEDVALNVDLQWDWDNNHIIDTSDDKFSGVSDEFWDMLLEDKDFKDVSDLKRIPTNGAQQMWRGLPKTEEGDPSVSKTGRAETDETSHAGGGPSEADASTTTTATPARARGATKAI